MSSAPVQVSRRFQRLTHFGSDRGIADIGWPAAGSIRSRMPSRPGELHPESLTDPDVILSHHQCGEDNGSNSI
jgi:hypothetical protein